MAFKQSLDPAQGKRSEAIFFQQDSCELAFDWCLVRSNFLKAAVAACLNILN